MRSSNPRDKAALNKSSKELKETKQKIDNDTFQCNLENLSSVKNDDYTL